MPDLDQLALAPSAHRNQHLFSDHYLNENLPKRPQWGEMGELAQDMMERIASILSDFNRASKERQTERKLVMPVLEALGHTFDEQASLKTPDGTNTPDYVFYRDAEACNANIGQVLTGALPQQGAIAVGDAKMWNRSLDIAVRSNGASALSNKNPSYQISFYMLHSGVTWGILTNGKQWRLYHKDTAHKLDHFYEVDLEELVLSNDVGRFLYFYAFFRREAFDDGALSIDAILRESMDYARSVGASLKEQVYDALRHIAQGFLDYAPNKLHPDSDTLKTIYDNSLILLYRLIFVLYAEARDLLPLKESKPYRDAYSLHAIKHGTAAALDSGQKLLASSAHLWPQLDYLFHAINDGNPPLSISTFNGGLFDPGKHRFLAKYRVGDGHLQQAIDKLARVNHEFVDYRDLSVRHMGTIYEGLLEYRLQPLSVPEDGWHVELVNDKGERKATGSYYTPDYIVKYIVENAVGPVLERAIEGKSTDADTLQAVLEVNVLDPAMGSGHFLVEATEYIARFLVDLAILPEGKTQEEADLAFWKRRVVQSCVYGVDLNPLAVELAKLSLWLTTVAKDRPLSFLDHHLRTGNSLVGARLEHLELGAGSAKGKGKGKRRKSPGQVSLFADSDFTLRVRTAVDSMWLIEGSEARDVRQVKEQERMYSALRKKLTDRYIRLLNLVAAAHFGLDLEEKNRSLLIGYAASNKAATFPAFEKILAQADEIATRERFFHWELEFPEIYFDRQGRPLGDEGGFEAVVGNPPYVEQERLIPYKPYFRQHSEIYHGVADLYLYFYEQGLRVAQQGGRLAFISSGTFARANFASAFRQWLPKAAHLETIIDFGENQPFQGAEMVRPSIAVMQKGAQDAGFRSLFLAAGIPPSLESAVATDGVDSSPDALRQPEWVFEGAASMHLLQKILGVGRSLASVVGDAIYYGIKTGLNEAFVVDQATRDRLAKEDPSCAGIIKPVLRGEDLRPWYQENEGRWLVAIPCGWTRSTFGSGLSTEAAWSLFSQRHPAIAAYLLPFALAAESRCDKGDYWWELRPCDYYQAFDQPKVFWPDIAKLPRFSWDAEGKFINNKGYIMPCEDAFLLGILQSRVSWFATSQICQPLRLRAGLWQYQMFTQFTSRLPVPAASPTDRAALCSVADSASDRARDRYALHCRVRHRLESDLAAPGTKLNQKLTAWWGLDFAGLRVELRKALKTDIPVQERDQWEAWFTEQRGEHKRLTDEIVSLETELNDRVYALFDLTPDEIKIIEESTKYKYGEV